MDSNSPSKRMTGLMRLDMEGILHEGRYCPTLFEDEQSYGIDIAPSHARMITL